MKTVYFDNAATTPLRKDVIANMYAVLMDNYGNPSSTYKLGRSAKLILEQSRKSIAQTLNALPSEIVFTSGGTEAINLVLQSAVINLGVSCIITTRIEHHAVLNTVAFLKQQYGTEVIYLNVNTEGLPDLVQLETILKTKQQVLVSLMHVNNEVGSITDIKYVGELCKMHKALFHTDAVQSYGHYKLDVNVLKVNFLTASAHKLHGPKGIGFAYVQQHSGLKPLIYGGEQERGLRSGTESVHNLAGFKTAVELAYTNLESECLYISELKVYCKAELQQQFPDIVFNGSQLEEQSAYTILNVSFPSLKPKATTLLFQLDLKGVACSKGSACQSGSNTRSHVLSEILPEKEFENPALRFSFSAFNTKSEVDYLVEVLKEL